MITTAKTLPKTSTDIWLNRLKDEFDASQFYAQASIWCENNGFFKASAYYKKEAENERGHAQGIIDYLTGWNCEFTLPAIKSPEDFKDLIDIINKQYGIEDSLRLAYNSDSQTLFSSDLNSFDKMQEYRKIQDESVIEVSDMINVLEGVEPTKFNLLLLEEQIFG